MKDDFAQNGSFLRDIDIDKLANILPECSARQIDDLRRTFRTIYRAYNVKETFKDDVEKLKLLKTKIEIIRVNSDKMDRIQVKQLGYFENNLRDIISRME